MLPGREVSEPWGRRPRVLRRGGFAPRADAKRRGCRGEAPAISSGSASLPCWRDVHSSRGGLGVQPPIHAPSGRLCCREAIACELGSCTVQRRLCGAASCWAKPRLSGWLGMCDRSGAELRRLCGAASRRGDPRLQAWAAWAAAWQETEHIQHAQGVRCGLKPVVDDSLRRLCGAANRLRPAGGSHPGGLAYEGASPALRATRQGYATREARRREDERSEYEQRDAKRRVRAPQVRAELCLCTPGGQIHQTLFSFGMGGGLPFERSSMTASFCQASKCPTCFAQGIRTLRASA